MKIICIGRNYLAHAKELNNALPEVPLYFMKPDTAIVRNNNPFFYPEFSTNLHYELEVVLKITKLGRNISEKFAHRYYTEIGLGIDFTARDLQQKCIEKGWPWEMAKSFDNSAPISHFIKKSELGDVYNLDFKLEKNGEIVQHGNTKDLIFNFEKLISYVSKFVTFRTGDLMFTGTPAGVGPVAVGDRLKAYLNDELMLDFFVK